MAALEPSLAGLSPAAAEAQRQTFHGLLTVVGTPALAGLTHAVTQADLASYADAYVAGMRVVLLLAGAAAVLGGVIAWLFLGRRDPLITIWEHSDERDEPAVAGPGGTAGGADRPAPA
jgi:hypothetical protein